MISALVALVFAQATAAGAVVQLIAQEEEQMALSAAPEHLRAGAGVYRLETAEFREVRPSSNGFNCLVAREPSLGLGPVCYDAEGSRTNMQADVMRGQLRAQGKSEADVEAAVKQAYAGGKLKAPSRPGIAYMLSTHFTEVNAKTGQRQCIFPPPVMFYAPYLKNADIGAEQKHFGSTHQPWVLSEGEPNAHILVVGHGVDAAACR